MRGETPCPVPREILKRSKIHNDTLFASNTSSDSLNVLVIWTAVPQSKGFFARIADYGGIRHTITHAVKDHKISNCSTRAQQQ